MPAGLSALAAAASLLALSAAAPAGGAGFVAPKPKRPPAPAGVGAGVDEGVVDAGPAAGFAPTEKVGAAGFAAGVVEELAAPKEPKGLEGGAAAVVDEVAAGVAVPLAGGVVLSGLFALAAPNPPKLNPPVDGGAAAGVPDDDEGGAVAAAEAPNAGDGADGAELPAAGLLPNENGEGDAAGVVEPAKLKVGLGAGVAWPATALPAGAAEVLPKEKVGAG